MASSAFQTGFGKAGGKKKSDDDDSDSKPQGSGSSTAFQAGWNKASDKRKAKKGRGGGSGGGGLSGLLGGGIIPVIEKAIGSRKHGGPIRKTGLYHLHAGEHVVPAGKHRPSKRASHKRTVIKT